jgi:DNA-binding beta-propeller fold protein YncE
MSRSAYLTVAMLSWINYSACVAQPSYGTDKLILEKNILMPGVKGRLDHLDVDLKHQIVYVAALGNNSVEVIDLKLGKLIHTIRGLDEPQGIGYIPQNEEVFVANGGNGDGYFFSTKNFQKIATVHMGSDADDVRYDSADRKLYVGYGSGGIAIINADNHQLINNIKLPAHPESFQLDRSLGRIFVNLPDAGLVGIINLPDSKLANKWITKDLAANFPMALDEINHRVFIGFRSPARMVTLDGKTSNPISSIAMVGDADDLYYDPVSGSIIVSGGEGAISIFSKTESGQYKQTANIPTRKGARTSLLIIPFRLFVVAARAESSNEATLMVYKLNLNGQIN